MGITAGAKAWVGLAVYVLAYDAFAILTGRDTMSSAFANALRDPKKRFVPLLAWWTTTAHLHQVLGKYDPLSNLERIPLFKRD